MFEELLAAGFRPLIEYRRDLPPTMTAEAVREAVLARAEDMGFTAEGREATIFHDRTDLMLLIA